MVATDAGLPKIIKDAIEKRIVIPEDPQKKMQEQMWENLQKYKTLSKKKKLGSKYDLWKQIGEGEEDSLHIS